MGNNMIRNLKDKQETLKYQIKKAFRERINNLTMEFVQMDDLIAAPELSSRLFKDAETFIASVQNIELALHNYEKEVYKYKMKFYKLNNEGRAKMDALLNIN